MNNLLKAKWVLLTCFFLSLVFSYAYIKVMDWWATGLSWISVGLVQGSLIAIGTFAFLQRKDNKLHQEETGYLTWIMWISWILAALFLVFVLCNLKSLRISIAVIDTAADFVVDTKRGFLLPVLYFTVGLFVTLIWLYGFICVCSIGTITADNYAI